MNNWLALFLLGRLLIGGAGCGPIGPRTHWFWIDDRDWRSKRTLSVVLFLFTLTDSGSNEHLPVLTIPAG